jgi:uncharacterized membrane protein YebE (DUF533 family)
MIDYQKLLDAVVGAIGRPEPHHYPQDPQGNPTKSATQVQQGLGQLAGQSPQQLLQKAKDIATQHPGLTQAALIGLAGLMFGKRKKSGITGNLVKLGGLALIGNLAYKAFQKQQAGRDKPGASQEHSFNASGSAESPDTQSTVTIPQTSRFHPVSQTEDDALLFLRAMIAAAASDGHIDEGERARIIKGLAEAGIDPQATSWLEREMASPADVEELSSGVNNPELAAQVYTAARIAINPDTIQEREFLRQLAEALDLDQAMRSQIEDTVESLA